MFRSLAGLILASTTFAQAPQPPAVAPSSGHVELVRVSPGKDGGLQMTQSVSVPQTVEVTVFKLIDGNQVPVKEKRTVTQVTTMEVALSAKDFKATGVDGKDIPMADLEKKVKGGAVAVMSFAPLSADQRKVFKDDIVFIERTPIVVAAPPKPEK